MTGMDYQSLLANKAVRAPSRGLRTVPTLNPALFPYQRDCTEYLLGTGTGAAFLDTGLGKSLIELEYGRVIAEHTGRPVLMFAPLAVGPQHAREAEKFGIDDVRTVRDQHEVRPGINIANYERLHLFDPAEFSGVILDESSIIKSFTGITTRRLMQFADKLDWRLAATATPAPNDHMELGQHSQFLDIMSSSEMLTRWFIADQSGMGRYRLKRHGIDDFWSWVASWSRMLARPSDLGYSNDGFDLPPLNTQLHRVDTDITANTDGALFRMPGTSATNIHKEKRLTAGDRADECARWVTDEPNEAWVIWCETDYEADALMQRIPDAVEVRGSMPADTKESRLVDFSLGNIRILVTKPKIAGFGLNWQHCARTGFCGLSFSYEQYYQAVRRFYRFGQQRPVDVHIAMAETEQAIWATIKRKADDHETMKANMFQAMRRATQTATTKHDYQPRITATLPAFLHAA